MRFTAAIDVFVQEMTAEGRFNSPKTEATYRATLAKHADDVGNRDPSKTGRDDVKATLRRWQGNTRVLAHAHLRSFYDFAVEEGWRKDNPARQVRRTKKRQTAPYRLTREEVRAIRAAARGPRERAMVDFGFLAGLRASELLALQGRHLRRRPGWVWVSADIVKGKRHERYVLVLPELEPTYQHFVDSVGEDEFVIPHRNVRMNFVERVEAFDPSVPCSYGSLYRAVKAIGYRAGLREPMRPHLMRHAYGDHLARFAGIEVAQNQLGHLDISTTQTYTGGPAPEEIVAALKLFGYGELSDPEQGSRRLVEAAGTFHREYLSCDPVRDMDLGGFPGVVRWLFANPGLRAAARNMADVS